MFDFFGFIFFLLFLIVFAIVATARARTRRLNRLEAQIEKLSDEFRQLEKLVRTIPRKSHTGVAAEPSAARTVSPREGAAAEKPSPPAPVKPAAEPVAASAPETPKVPAATPRPALARMAPQPGPKPKPAAQAARPLPEEPHKPVTPPPGALDNVMARISHALPRRGMTLSDWEALVGGNWLNKLGIVVFVVGVTLLLGYSLRYFGPAGKIATGVATGLVLLVGGFLLERKTQYSAFAKPVIGGGWAIVYFTAFAAYNVEASKIIDEPGIALFVMAVVAAGMILHSLRYRAQVVTAIAYGLGYLAIVISPLTTFSLLAIALLAASLIAVLRRLPWYHLALVAELGTYLSHFMWMGQSTSAPTAAGIVFNVAVLSLYWLLFTILLFLKRGESGDGGRMLLLVTVANATGFLALGGWSVRASFPENMYLFAGGATLAYAALSALTWRQRRERLFWFTASLAVVLAAFTAPLAGRAWPNADPEWLALYWAVEAGVVVTIGFRLRQLLLRLESYLLCLASLLALAFINLGSSTEGRHVLVWVSVVPVIGFFYYMFEKLRKAAGHADVLAEARNLGIVLGYAATGILALLLWREVPTDLVGLAWLAVGLMFFEVGRRVSRPHLRGQAYVLAALAAFGFALINVLEAVTGSVAPIGASSWILVPPGIVGLYYLYGRVFVLARSKVVVLSEVELRELASAAASTVLALLLWRELPAEVVGIAWLACTLVLFEVGRRIGSYGLRLQAYALAALAVAALFIVDLYGVAGPDVDSYVASRWLIVLPAVAAYYYLFMRLQGNSSGRPLLPPETSQADVASVAATALLAVLFWSELPSVAVALAWGVFGVALFEIGASAALPILCVQGHVLFGAAVVRLFMANFTSTTATFGISHRLATVAPLIVMTYYLFLRLRERYSAGVAAASERRLDIVYSYVGALLLAVLARFEFGRAYTVMAWAPLVLGFLAIGVLRNERHFRFQSYILAILAFARSWATNMYLTGSFYGVPERFATMVPMIVAFLVAALFCIRRRATFAGEATPHPAQSLMHRVLRRLDVHSITLFSLLGPVLAAILLQHEVSGNLLTMAWSIEGFLVLALGFIVVERSFRLFGLGLLAVCVAKLIFIDLEGVDTIYRIFSYIVLGLLLLLASFVYTRYRDTIRRYL